MPTHDVRAAVAALAAVMVLAACSPSAGSDDPEDRAGAAGPAPTWASTFTSHSAAVARVTATGCAGTTAGSGFLVGPDVLVTAHHVVADASAVSLRFGSDVVAGTTVAVDPEADLAVVRLAEPARDDALHLAPEPAAPGTAVAALGYRPRAPLGMTRGAVAATDVRAPVNGADRRGLFRTDAPLDPDTSGGPVVTVDGDVVGVAVAGYDATDDGFAVALPALRDLLKATDDGTADPPAVTRCESNWDGDALTSDPVQVSVTSDHPDAPAIAQTMQLYAESVNAGYMDTVWDLLTPDMQERAGTLEHYAAALSTSTWYRLDVEHVEALDDTRDTAEVTFRTLQDAEHGPDGATCADWRVTYTFALDAGTWQIDGAEATDGVAAQPCVLEGVGG